MTEGARTDITKQEAASRQLETAVVLFFCDDDAISIHVLASSASQILYDVCKHRGATSIRDIWQDYIAEEYRSKWIKKTKQAYNYFKHAKDDPFTELERFDPRSNEWLLFAACIDYVTAYTFAQAPFEVTAYFTWFLATHPGIMRKDRPLADVITESQALKGLGEKSPYEQRQWAADMLRATYEHLERRPPVTGLRCDRSDIGVIDNTLGQ